MLYKLMNRIISKSFFQMKGLPIEIKFSNVFEKEDAYCIYYSRSNDKNKFVIDIDWSLQKNRKAIIGAIAHELNHIQWEMSNSSDYYKKDYKMYQKYLMHRWRDEAYTDFKTILQGYGKELLELMEHYDQFPTKEYQEGLYCGLKAKDIKKLIS